jgi:hypothetical protein
MGKEDEKKGDGKGKYTMHWKDKLLKLRSTLGRTMLTLRGPSCAKNCSLYNNLMADYP